MQPAQPKHCDAKKRVRRSKARPSRGDAPSRCTAGRWCLTGVAAPTPRSRRRWRFARSPSGRRLSHRSKCTRACGWIRCRRSSPRTTRRARCGRVRTVALCVEKLLCFPAAQHAPSSATRQHRRQQQGAHQQTEGRRHAVGVSSCEQEARGAPAAPAAGGCLRFSSHSRAPRGAPRERRRCCKTRSLAQERGTVGKPAALALTGQTAHNPENESQRAMRTLSTTRPTRKPDGVGRRCACDASNKRKCEDAHPRRIGQLRTVTSTLAVPGKLLEREEKGSWGLDRQGGARRVENTGLGRAGVLHVRLYTDVRCAKIVEAPHSPVLPSRC